jgi:hypothetical protein
MIMEISKASPVGFSQSSAILLVSLRDDSGVGKGFGFVDTHTGEVVGRLNAFNLVSGGWMFSTDARVVAVTGEDLASEKPADTAIKVIQTRGGKELLTFTTGMSQPPVLLSPDGGMVAILDKNAVGLIRVPPAAH